MLVFRQMKGIAKMKYISQWTKGGWSRNIRPVSRYPIIFAGRNTHVAQVITRGLSEAEAEANCNLIAAAPAMAEALQSIIDGLSGDLQSAVLQAQKALALAHGVYE